MEREQLRKIVAQHLEIEPDELQSDTELASIETFDSVSVLGLMIVLDEQAGIQMSLAELGGLRRYGDIEQIAVAQGVCLRD